MHFHGLSIAFIFSCYFNWYAKAIYTFSKKDSILKVPLHLEDLLMGINLRSHSYLENELTDKAEITALSMNSNVDLRGLYSTLKHHPELMDRRLKIGGKTPPPLPDRAGLASISKRTAFDIGVAQPSCPFKTEWVRLTHARDINNTHVEIFQPSDNNSNRFQWFYTVTCDYDLLLIEDSDCPFCCRAVNHRRFASQCVPRKTYVMALIRKTTSQDFDWGYIQVDSSCNCAVTPRP